MSATTSAPQPAPASPLRGLAMRHPLVSFFVLAYAFTWIAWSPWYLSESGVALFVVLAMSIAIVITWVFNNSRQSVLLAILAHGSLNSAAVSMYAPA